MNQVFSTLLLFPFHPLPGDQADIYLVPPGEALPISYFWDYEGGRAAHKEKLLLEWKNSGRSLEGWHSLYYVRFLLEGPELEKLFNAQRNGKLAEKLRLTIVEAEKALSS